MSLTICFVVYNEEKNLSFLEENLRDLRGCEVQIKTLIVDNGSNDGSSMQLKNIAQRYQATYVRRANNHLPQARQLALELATTTWIGYIDADCRIDSCWSSLVMQKISLVPPPFSAFGGPWKIAGEWSLVYRSLFGSFLGHFGLPYLNLKRRAEGFVEHLPTANIVYHRATLLQVGGFCSTDPYVGEDLDVSCRLRLQKHPILFVPDMIVEHYLPSQWGHWIVKMFRYGWARGKCLWTYHSLFTLKALIPFLFSVFLLFSLMGVHPLMDFAVVFYLSVCFSASFFLAPISEGARVFLLMLATHFFYSLGALVGFFQAFLGSAFLAPTSAPPTHKVPKVENAL